LRWEQRDIVSDGPPGGSWRLILCRNLAIYLASEAKDALHERLATALAPGGILMVGRSERLSNPRALGLEAAAARAYRRLR
jgi:chemotaxis protein methyltransferase CheR